MSITANPDPDWLFDHWILPGGVTSSTNPTVITMDSNKAVQAHFVDANNYTLTTVNNPPNAGSVYPSWGSYAPSTAVEIDANPAFGYRFSHWTGTPTFSSSSNPATVTMNSHQQVTAHYVPTYMLYTGVIGGGYPDDTGCGIITPEEGWYDAGSVVQLTAVASPGWRFYQWSGDAIFSTNPYNLTMNSNKSVAAHFWKTWNLSTTVIGQGSVNPPAATIYSGEPATLTATPAQGWRFVEWSGDATGAISPVVVTMDAHKAVTATFERIWYSLTTECVPQEAGHITPTGQPFPSDVVVTVTAVPHAGWCFKEWQGDLTGTPNPQTLTMDSAKSVTAVFEELETLTYGVEGGGTVTIEPMPTESGPGWASFLPNTIVQLTATAAQNSLFDYWEGNIDPGGDPHALIVTLTMTDDMSTTAHFLARPGLSEIDMLADLADFLTEIGAVETIDTWDRNEVAYDEDGERVYVGNGIPDAAELYLLEKVLKSRRLNLTPRGGVSHDAVWDMWAANLAQAQADLPTGPSTVQRVVAGYMTIGTFGSAASIEDLIQTHFMVTIEPLTYERNSNEYLGSDRDADRDGLSNYGEWTIAAPTGDLSDKDAFAAAALDGLGGSGGVPGGGGSGCTNAPCLDTGTVNELEPIGLISPYVAVPLPLCGGTATPSGPDIAVGTKIEVQSALGYPAYLFSHWYAPGSLIHWSREQQDRFPLMQTEQDVCAVFERATLRIPLTGVTATGAGIVNVVEEIDGQMMRLIHGPPRTLVRLTTENTHTGWVVNSTTQAPCYNYSDGAGTVALQWRVEDAAPFSGSSLYDPVTLALTSSEGGKLLGSHSNGWPGVFGSSITTESHLRYLSLSPLADPGYMLVGINGTHATFAPKETYNLTVKRAGAAVGCSGYVTVEPAKKYYAPGDLVTVTAHIEPGYAFKGWDGCFIAADGKQPEEIDDLEFQLFMNENWEVTAVFREPVVDARLIRHVWNESTLEYDDELVDQATEEGVVRGDSVNVTVTEWPSNGAVYAWDHNHQTNADITDADCNGVDDLDDDTNGQGATQMVACIPGATWQWPDRTLNVSLNVNCDYEALLEDDVVPLKMNEALVINTSDWSGSTDAYGELRTLRYFCDQMDTPDPSDVCKLLPFYNIFVFAGHNGGSGSSLGTSEEDSLLATAVGRARRRVHYSSQRTYRLVMLHACNSFNFANTWRDQFAATCLVGWNGLLMAGVLEEWEMHFWDKLHDNNDDVAAALGDAWNTYSVQLACFICGQNWVTENPSALGSVTLPSR